jgi:spore coat polysaccharide biosynthesis predicted glycosyltransferase SpsG/L-amino acid N-acyltransferase YncA
MTTLVLRADGGPAIGVGHLARCLAFAEAAVERGWEAVLAGDLGGATWLAERFAALGVPVRQASALDDLAADVVLVDHYGLGELPEVRERARLVCLEDGRYGRRAADVVVDPSLAFAARPADGSAVCLAGPRFAPVRADVVAARRARTGVAGDPPRVVVVMGGGAAGPTVAAALTALRDTGLPMSVRAVAAGEVTLPEPASGQHFTVGPPTPALPELLAGADLAVSAAGVTLTELCCIGVPAAIVELVDNQAAGYRAALDLGLAAGLGAPADLPQATDTLHTLLTDPRRRAALAEAAAATVDGAGPARVLDAATLEVREACQADADTLLTWRNDPQTLRWSRGHQQVAQPVHASWLAATTVDPDRLLLVVERAGRGLGTVRFDRVGDGTWEVSITVAPEQRGRGLAEGILTVGEGALLARTPARTVLANVHEENKASLALFQRAGYLPADRPADGPYRWLTRRLG